MWENVGFFILTSEKMGTPCLSCRAFYCVNVWKLL